MPIRSKLITIMAFLLSHIMEMLSILQEQRKDLSLKAQGLCQGCAAGWCRHSPHIRAGSVPGKYVHTAVAMWSARLMAFASDSGVTGEPREVYVKW